MANPLKAIQDIRRHELPLALLMFGYFFLVITSFWILKPLKKGFFIEHYDALGFNLLGWQMTAAEAELLAKVLNMVVAFLAVTVFTALAGRFRRQQLTFLFSAFFMAGYIGYAAVLDRPGEIAVWSFYLFGDLFSTLMVATFFAFLNDSVTADAAKRMYGLVGLGGTTGGAFGSLFVQSRVEAFSTAAWMWISFGIAALIIVIAFIAGRLVDRDPPPESGPAHRLPRTARGENPAIEGARLVFRSRYLLTIVCIVGLYEIVSTVMDFQFSATIAHYLDGPAIRSQFSRIFTITNITAMVVQLFLTSAIMSRLGMTTALLVLPLAVAAGSAGFLAFPILWVGSFLNTADNGFSYSINQSAKEALYVPTTRDEKYKAKAFIDMFVQRFAKSIAVGVSLAVSAIFTDFSGIRWLSIVTLAIVAVWIGAARFAGRRFAERAGASPGDRPR